MWTIYDDGNLIYDDSVLMTPRLTYGAEVDSAIVGLARVGISTDVGISTEDGYLLSDITYEQELGKAGSLSFVCYPGHWYYDSFVALNSRIELYRDGELYWFGRIYSIEIELDGAKTITCEGQLAVLNDSILRPYTTDSSGVSTQITYDEGIDELLADMLANHNSQVGENKQLQVGSIGSTSTEILYREFENYESTYDRISDLADTLTAYPRVRCEDGIDYLDFLQEDDYSDETSNQTIDFGDNLLSLTQEQAADEFYTVLIPLGADVETEDDEPTYPLNIASVNGGKDYLEADSETLAKYGRIVGTLTWDDVTTPAQLMYKGQEYLNTQAQTFVSITATAVDMAKAGSKLADWRIGDAIAVTSKPHGLDTERFIVKKISLDLQDPANNTISLSQTRPGLASYNRKAEKNIINKLYGEVNQKIYDSNADLRTWITVNESTIEQTSDAIRLFCRQFLTDEEYDEVKDDISALFEVTAGVIMSKFASLWITESEEGIRIGRDGSTMQSLQDNDSYEFIDTNINTTVVTLDTTGLTATRVGAKQFELLDGAVKQWALRKGPAVSGTGAGLDIVWIGG